MYTRIWKAARRHSKTPPQAKPPAGPAGGRAQRYSRAPARCSPAGPAGGSTTSRRCQRGRAAGPPEACFLRSATRRAPCCFTRRAQRQAGGPGGGTPPGCRRLDWAAWPEAGAAAESSRRRLHREELYAPLASRRRPQPPRALESTRRAVSGADFEPAARASNQSAAGPSPAGHSGGSGGRQPPG